MIIGNPGGMGNWVATLGSYLRPREDAVDLQGNPVREFVATTPTMGGNSGSPVFDLDGNVVGVLWGGENPDDDRKIGDSTPPAPSSSGVRDFITTADLSLSVAIEEAIDIIAPWR